jgi:hypothetical protein
VFAEGAAHDAVLVGHGDWKPDEEGGVAGADRTNQLTPVIYRGIETERQWLCCVDEPLLISSGI